MAAIMASRIVGADPIIGVDIIPMRLALALQLGATHTIDNRHDDVASRISEIAGGGVDYVVETTGNPKLVKLAQKVLNPNGTVAVFSGTRGPVSLTEGRTMLGIIEGDAVPQQFIPRMIELYQAGQFPFDRLIRFYDLREINRAIADAKRGDTIKPVLRVNESLSVGE
jgi:aryl-alcohol dehydrogenase